MRYNRLHDIGLSDDQIKKNLLFATDKVGDTMKVALDPRQAKDWFGAAPPDLSVIARSRAEIGQGQRRRLPLHLLRTLLPRRHQADRLEQPRLPRRRACRTCCGNCRASGAPSSSKSRIRTTPTQDDASLRRLRAGHAGHARRAPVRRGRRPTWSRTCNGWASRRRARACASASGCCVFLGLFTLIAWRLNAAYWRDRQLDLPPPRERGACLQAKPATAPASPSAFLRHPWELSTMMVLYSGTT